MKRTQTSRMPIQLGPILNGHSTVSAPMNCHTLGTPIAGNVNGGLTTVNDYESPSFDLLGLSSIPIDIELDTPSSPESVQPSMMDQSMDIIDSCSHSLNCPNHSLQNNNPFGQQTQLLQQQQQLQQHQSQHPHRHNHNHHHSQQNIGREDAQQLLKQNISTHIHRNSYSDSNSPSVVSSLSSSCSVSPQSADLSFGMSFSAYQAQNPRGSLIEREVSEPIMMMSPSDQDTATNNTTQLSQSSALSNSFPNTVPAGFADPFASALSSSLSNHIPAPVQPSTAIFDFESGGTNPVLLGPNNNTGAPHKNPLTNANDLIFSTTTAMHSNKHHRSQQQQQQQAGQQQQSQQHHLKPQHQPQSQINTILSSVTTSVPLGTPTSSVVGVSDCSKNVPKNCNKSKNNDSNNSSTGIGIANNCADMNGASINSTINGILNSTTAASGSSSITLKANNSIINANVSNGSANNSNSALCPGQSSALSLMCGNGNSAHSKSHCKVCGDTAIGKNFGVLTCGSCKIFFRRNCNEDKCKLICRNNNNCVITKTNRRNCARCRLQKCRDLGMKLKQSRHPRDIRRDICTNDTEGHQCCPSNPGHCIIEQDCQYSKDGIDSDGCQVPEDIPSLISEDEARRRFEESQRLLEKESEILDFVVDQLEEEEDCEKGYEEEYSDADDVLNDEAEIFGLSTIKESNPVSGINEPLSQSTQQTLPETVSQANDDKQTNMETEPVEQNFKVPIVPNAVNGSTAVEPKPVPVSSIQAVPRHNIEQQDSDSDVEDAVPQPDFELDSPEAIIISEQRRNETFYQTATKEQWENYHKIFGDKEFDYKMSPEEFENKMIELYKNLYNSRKRQHSDVELIKAEARNLPSKIDHQINELCQLTSFIRIDMGLDYRSNENVADLMNKELERIAGLNKSCQMIDIRPKNGPKEFSVSDSLKQGIFYADKSFKLLEKFWRLNPELNELSMLNEKSFDTRKKNNLLHMLYHLRGVYNFDDNKDAWLVPSSVENNSVAYVKLTMFNQSIKKEMTTIHKKYIQSFPKLWREDLTIFNLMTFLLFFLSFDDRHSQYKFEKMRFLNVMYLLKRYLHHLYGDENRALAMLRLILSLINDLKWLCKECLNACTHSFKLDVLQEVAPNYADLLLTEENAKNQQPTTSSTVCSHHCKKARCES